MLAHSQDVLIYASSYHKNAALRVADTGGVESGQLS